VSAPALVAWLGVWPTPSHGSLQATGLRHSQEARRVQQALVGWLVFWPPPSYGPQQAGCESCSSCCFFGGHGLVWAKQQAMHQGLAAPTLLPVSDVIPVACCVPWLSAGRATSPATRTGCTHPPAVSHAVPVTCWGHCLVLLICKHPCLLQQQKHWRPKPPS
jgi:hypothetical protein